MVTVATMRIWILMTMAMAYQKQCMMKMTNLQPTEVIMELPLACLVIKISNSLVMKEKEMQLLLEEGNMEINTNLYTNENEDAKFLIHDTDSNQIEKSDSDSDVKMHKIQNDLSSNDDNVERDVLNSIIQQSYQTKSWHMEILFELFLQCDEKKMKHLAEQSESLISPQQSTGVTASSIGATTSLRATTEVAASTATATTTDTISSMSSTGATTSSIGAILSLVGATTEVVRATATATATATTATLTNKAKAMIKAAAAKATTAPMVATEHREDDASFDIFNEQDSSNSSNDASFEVFDEHESNDGKDHFSITPKEVLEFMLK
jgi:hypothetical protein